MKRRLMQFFFGLGLLLTLAAAALWLRGGWVNDQFVVYYQRGGGDGGGGEYVTDQASLFSSRAQLTFVLTRTRLRAVDFYGHPPAGLGAHHLRSPRPTFMAGRPGSLAGRLGFGYFFEAAAPTSQLVLGSPPWFVGALCAAVTALPALPLHRARRARRRAARGLCPACGYDLRGAAHERCPECGEVVEGHLHGESSALSKMK